MSVEVVGLLPRLTADVSIKIRPSGWFHVKVVLTKTLTRTQLGAVVTVTMTQVSHWLSIVFSSLSLSRVSSRLSTQDGCYFNRLTVLKVGDGTANDYLPLER